MNTNELIKEIERLPLSRRIYILEKTLQSIRAQQDIDMMTNAANELVNEYENNKELTAFTNLDLEDFYETK